MIHQQRKKYKSPTIKWQIYSDNAWLTLSVSEPILMFSGILQ